MRQHPILTNNRIYLVKICRNLEFSGAKDMPKSRFFGAPAGGGLGSRQRIGGGLNLTTWA
jgi:hypothetical protein